MTEPNFLSGRTRHAYHKDHILKNTPPIAERDAFALFVRPGAIHAICSC
jgi:hypothetical protein